MLRDEHLAYLLRRGYTPALIGQEEIFSISKGEFSDPEELKNRFYTDLDVIGFRARSMSGDTAGIHTACSTEKRYAWHPTPGKPFLPILYGSEADLDLLYKSGEMVLAEGVFDRVAVKRCLPEKAVFARLSKGVSGQLAIVVKRYAKRLWLAFDIDEAGKLGAEKTELRVGKEVETLALQYPTKDPALLLEKWGVLKMEEHLRKEMSKVGL